MPARAVKLSVYVCQLTRYGTLWLPKAFRGSDPLKMETRPESYGKSLTRQWIFEKSENDQILMSVINLVWKFRINTVGNSSNHLTPPPKKKSKVKITYFFSFSFFFLNCHYAISVQLNTMFQRKMSSVFETHKNFFLWVNFFLSVKCLLKWCGGSKLNLNMLSAAKRRTTCCL